MEEGYFGEKEEKEYRSYKMKTFIKAGEAYIDIKNTLAFKFKKSNPYVKILVYFKNTDKPIEFEIKNRNELSLLFLELEYFFDDPNLLSSLNALMDEIENLEDEEF